MQCPTSIGKTNENHQRPWRRLPTGAPIFPQAFYETGWRPGHCVRACFRVRVNSHRLDADTDTCFDSTERTSTMTKVNLVLSCLLSLRRLAARSLGQRVMAAVIVFVALLVLLVAPGSVPAQQAPLHLNPAVEKLAHGQSIIGTQTDDMSLQNCHSLARLDFDYAYVDMDHGPLNLDA